MWTTVALRLDLRSETCQEVRVRKVVKSFASRELCPGRTELRWTSTVVPGPKCRVRAHQRAAHVRAHIERDSRRLRTEDPGPGTKDLDNTSLLRSRGLDLAAHA